MFIKLTEAMTGGDERILILNINQIQHAQAAVKAGHDTHIRLNISDGSGKLLYYFVKESVDEIQAMLNNKVL